MTGVVVILALWSGAEFVRAQEVTFPIAELGGCESRASCEAYCSEESHTDACVAFGLAHGLFDEREAAVAQRVVESGGGPGRCRSEQSCHAYCEEAAHADECVEFGVREGMIPPKEAAMVREVLKGGGPGGCKEKEQCEAYCTDGAHAEECFAFAQKHGLVKPEEAQMVREVMERGGPGGCRTEAACRAYCDEPDHMDLCMDFAVRNGMMDEAEAQRAREMMRNEVEGPAGCRGIECRDVCAKAENREACEAFAKEQGFGGDEMRDGMEGVMRDIPADVPDEVRVACQDPNRLEECRAYFEQMQEGDRPRDGVPMEERREFMEGERVRDDIERDEFFERRESFEGEDRREFMERIEQDPRVFDERAMQDRREFMERAEVESRERMGEFERIPEPQEGFHLQDPSVFEDRPEESRVFEERFDEPRDFEERPEFEGREGTSPEGFVEPTESILEDRTSAPPIEFNAPVEGNPTAPNEGVEPMSIQLNVENLRKHWDRAARLLSVAW